VPHYQRQRNRQKMTLFDRRPLLSSDRDADYIFQLHTESQSFSLANVA
jgi:hypothetical protein